MPRNWHQGRIRKGGSVRFPKTKRHKRDTLQGADATLWRLFSEYIRRRAADAAGLCFCVTCNKPRHWRDMDAGHFISRRFKGTKFDERNVHPQCTSCNSFQQGNQFEMVRYIEQRYGVGTAQLLRDLSRCKCRLDRLWYEEQIKVYRARLREIKHAA